MGKKKSEGGFVFYPFDAQHMDERLNTNAFQQVGNQLLKNEEKRKRR